MLSNPSKSTTNTLPHTSRRKKRTETINRIRTPRKIRIYRRRLFRVTRGNHGKKRQIRQNRIRRQITK